MTISAAQASAWEQHLLLTPPTPQSIPFTCMFKIWNNATLQLNPLTTNTGVTISIEDTITGAKTLYITNAMGAISGTILCYPARWYKVVAYIAGLKFGDRTYSLNPVIRIKSIYKNGAISLLPAELIVPRYIYPDYRSTISTSAQQPGFAIDYDISKHPQIREFEENYDPSNFNILVEGDSWFNSLSSPLDVYDNIKLYLESTHAKLKKPVRFLPLQSWGHTADSMFHNASVNSQVRYTLEYIAKYRFDLILLSCGGNDFALSFSSYLKSGLNPVAVVAAAKAIKANHSLPIDFDYEADIGAIAAYTNAVVGNTFSTIMFPVLTATTRPYEEIINLVYDMTQVHITFVNIYARIKDFIDKLLTEQYHGAAGIPVIMHSYDYPSYSDAGVHALGPLFAVDGPYIHPALEAKGVKNPVLQALCIKALIDAYKYHVLDDLVTEFDRVDPITNQISEKWFRFADVRGLAASSSDWADEMHLTAAASVRIAGRICAKVKQALPGMFDP